MDAFIYLMIFFLIFAFITGTLLIWVWASFRMDKRRRRLATGRVTRAVLSEITNELPGLVKKPIRTGKDQPARINVCDSLVGNYRGRLTYIRINFDDEGWPHNLRIDMVHKAKVTEDLTSIIFYGDKPDEFLSNQVDALIKKNNLELITVVGHRGAIDRMLLDEAALGLEVQMVSKKEELVKLLDIMSDMCKIVESKYGLLSSSDITSTREFRLNGKGILKFEPERLVFVDALNKRTIYQYTEIMLLNSEAEELDEEDELVYSIGLMFMDDSRLIFDIPRGKSGDRFGVRALVLDKLGLLEEKKEAKPTTDIINELSR